MSPTDVLGNTDLLLVSLAVAAIGILGTLVYINNRKSITNKSFFVFTLLTIAYGLVNYFASQIKDPFWALLLLRGTIFLAVWHAFSFFMLFYVFPSDQKVFNGLIKKLLLPVVIVTAGLTLTPFVFSGVSEILVVGQVPKASVDRGIYLFVALTFSLVIAGVYLLATKTRHAKSFEKKSYQFILAGIIITFASILIFNLVLPALFLNVRFIPLAPVYFLPFIMFTFYAIVKQHLFNVKVITTELATFGLWLLLLVRVTLAESATDFMLGSFIFLGSVGTGILLIRSVLTEVGTRETMEEMAIKLEVANEELKKLDETKSDFISIASHQLRTPLTIIKGYISMMREGTFGKITKKVQDPLDKVYISNERLINLVADLLDLSRMERGKMVYDLQEMHFINAIDSLVSDFGIAAAQKNLKFKWNKKDVPDLIKGDANKLRQIIINIIDNAIKYTPEGSVEVNIDSEPGKIHFSTTDTGVGMTEEEARELFQKFVRGQEQKKAHTEGLGLGLYVAKLIAQAHGGDLYATSPGKGKGSTFHLVLPLLDSPAIKPPQAV